MTHSANHTGRTVVRTVLLAARLLLLFVLPGAVGMLVDMAWPAATVGIIECLAVLAALTLTLGVIQQATFLWRGQGPRWQGLAMALPLAIPLTLLVLLTAWAPARWEWEVSLATGIGGTVGLIGGALAWTVISIRHTHPDTRR